ncbi:isochorismate synthase MenF [Gemmatimonadota bacterium]
MAKAETVEAPSGGERRLASASKPLEGVAPEALLRLGEGLTRGFWAREGRWFAHIGETATVQVPSPSNPGQRFEQVWAQARTLFSCSWKDTQSTIQPPSPRLFGGFSFRDDHEPLDAWEGFPPAHFVLPEVEFTGGKGSGVLTVRKLFPSELGAKHFRSELRSRLSEVGDSLAEMEREPARGEPWIPATRTHPDQVTWSSVVDRVLSAVEDGGVSKVVLARVQTVSVEGGVDAVDVVMNLWRENPGSHVFLFEPSPGHILLGAAPETVSTVSEGIFRATAVAGSIARGGDEAEQKSLARTLSRSQKDRREHRLCVEDVVDRLGPLSVEVHAQEDPHVLTLSTIQHLETAIEAHLHPGETVLSALEALHPTPAVCGFPRDQALEFIREEEPFQRGWYAGPVGWFDGDGNGVFVPALRSAVARGTEWRLFAGAGIVAGSNPAQEWEETRIKFQPVLRALSGARAAKGGEETDSLDS